MLCYDLGQYRENTFQTETFQKGGWVASELQTLSGFEIRTPQLLPEELLEIAHSKDYLHALKTGEPLELADSARLGWTGGLWRHLLASASCTTAACEVALEHGASLSLASGMHHGRRETGHGMCYINDLAIASLQHSKNKRVVILDFDAHGGWGTQSIVDGNPNIWQADVAISQFDRTHTGGNFYAKLVRDTNKYLLEINRALAWASECRPQLCLYNAGMDVHEDSGQNSVKGITTEVILEREKFVRSWAEWVGVPIVGMLAGGYISPQMPRQRLVDLHVATARELTKLS